MKTAEEGQDGDTCPLLEVLPREIRDEIWKLALLREEGVHGQSEEWLFAVPTAIKKNQRNLAKMDTKTYRPPALLSVNKQIRLEGSKIYYSTTLFVYSSSTLCAAWLKSLEPRCFRHIKKVCYCNGRRKLQKNAHTGGIRQGNDIGERILARDGFEMADAMYTCQYFCFEDETASIIAEIAARYAARGGAWT